MLKARFFAQFLALFALTLTLTGKSFAIQIPTQAVTPKGIIVALEDDDTRLILNQGELTEFQFKARLFNGKIPMTVVWEVLGKVDQSLEFQPGDISSNILKTRFTPSNSGSFEIVLKSKLTLANGKKIPLTANFTLEVRERPSASDFRLTIIPKALTLNSGSSITVQVLAESLNGFSDAITLEAQGRSGLDFTFRDKLILPSTATDLTITASSEIQEGRTTIQVTGTAGSSSLTRTTLIEIEIIKPIP